MRFLKYCNTYVLIGVGDEHYMIGKQGKGRDSLGMLKGRSRGFALD